MSPNCPLFHHFVSLFISARYGGVVVREKIAKAADWYVTSFDGLVAALEGFRV
jgi:hypothetical protein